MIRERPGIEIMEKAMLLLRPRRGSPKAKAVERFNNMRPTKQNEMPLLLKALETDEAVYSEYPEIRKAIAELRG